MPIRSPRNRVLDSHQKDTADNLILEETSYGFDRPWSIYWYFTIEGAEYLQIYFWIAKDLAWAQDWRIFSLVCGSFALSWYAILFFHAIRCNNGEEIYSYIGGFLWLFANFWWMAGEAHDDQFPDAPPLAETRTEESSYLLLAGLLWLAVYYLIIVPLDLMKVSKRALNEYDDGTIESRFSYFRNFRQYENIHTVFWMAKDLAWNQENISLWFVFLFPTIAISCDFIYLTSKHENSFVDVAHYLSILIWVIGNSVWALGEFFNGEYDDPIFMWDRSKVAFKTARWYSSWILISAYIPVIVMYFVWIPLTMSNKLREKKATDNDAAVFGEELTKEKENIHEYGSLVLSSNLEIEESDTLLVNTVLSTPKTKQWFGLQI